MGSRGLLALEVEHERECLDIIRWGLRDREGCNGSGKGVGGN